MNWLEFVIILVVALFAIAALLAMTMFALWTIKVTVKEIAKTVLEFATWTHNAYKKITA